jgi:predicted esterase
MKIDTSLILKRLAIIFAVLVLAFMTFGCGGDGDEGDGNGGVGRAPSPSPSPEAEIPDFPRLDGVTTAEDYAPFGDEGIGRWREDVPGIERVRIPSTMDDHEQPALWLPPGGDGPQPLLVVVHSWSTDYLQHLGIPFAEWAEESGWGMIAPDFRGVNDKPEATGSELAVQDVIDSIDFAAGEADIDEDRVFIVGFSGGGLMSLLMAGRHPDRFAGAVAWVPILDLVAWYEYNVKERPDAHYPGHIRASCGGDPTADASAREQCEQRSPRTHLDAAREAGVPVYIGHGLSDPIVPPTHSLLAFDQLAGDGEAVEDDVREAVADNRLPDEAQGSLEAETYFGDDDPEVFYARQAGPVTVVLFEGEHDMVYNPGLEWMWERAYGAAE